MCGVTVWCTELAATGKFMQLGLDDLFRKTETAPHLYWLPVAPKEEVASNTPGPTANGKV